jgi:lambda repressor-like predicted transcriptional regulator
MMSINTRQAMNPPLHREEIKAQLRMRFGSLAKFEQAKGLARNSVSFVLHGRPILPTAEAIAEELDIPVHRVSNLYHEQYCNLAVSPRYRRKIKDAHRENGEAA